MTSGRRITLLIMTWNLLRVWLSLKEFSKFHFAVAVIVVVAVVVVVAFAS